MIQIPLEIGDTILAGRFKNKKIKVNEIATDDFGNPTVNGRSILKIRIPKLYQKQENEMKINIKENLSPDKLKTIDKKIEWSTEKNLPLSQGSAIKEVISRYKIPAIQWGYVGTGAFIGVETKKQKMFWRDKGAELQFLGILNKDGSVTENKTLKEAVNPFQKSPLEVKIKQTDGSWHIYLQTVDGEECLTMTGWGTKEQAEHAAMMKGYSFDANKSSETPTRETPKYTGYEKVRSEKPEEMKLSKEKKIEIKLESMMREILGKKKALNELEVTDVEKVRKIEEMARLSDEFDRIKAEMEKIKKQLEPLDEEITKWMEEADASGERALETKNILITIKKKGNPKVEIPAYKERFERLYSRVNGALKKQEDEYWESIKKFKKIPTSIGVQYKNNESKINEDNVLSRTWSKVKSYFGNLFNKIVNYGKIADQGINELKRMV